MFRFFQSKTCFTLYFVLFFLLTNSPTIWAQKVFLDKTDSIRVKLYDTDNPNAIILTAYSESIRVILNSAFEIIVEPEEIVTIHYKLSNFSVEISNKRYPASEIRILNSENSLIKVKTSGNYPRYYHGRLDFTKPYQLKPINTIALEDYVASVVGSEMNFTHPEALKVQAVISRTYALWNVGTLGKQDFDLTDHTLNQVYLGEFIEKPWFKEAAKATENEIAVFGDKIILAVFSSTCGGTTCDNESVWSGNPLPYLRGQSDNDACVNSPHFNWSFSLSIPQWKSFIKTNYNQSNPNFIVREYSLENRAKFVGFSFNNEQYKANDFRLKMIQTFGSRSLKSLLFTVEQNVDSIIFNGKGMGHGVGLCQWGALGLAEAGWNYTDILRFYYRGIDIKPVYFDSEKKYLELAQ